MVAIKSLAGSLSSEMGTCPAVTFLAPRGFIRLTGTGGAGRSFGSEGASVKGEKEGVWLGMVAEPREQP